MSLQKGQAISFSRRNTMMTTKKMGVIIALSLFCSSTMLNGYKKKGDRSYRFTARSAYNSTVALSAVKPKDKNFIDNALDFVDNLIPFGKYPQKNKKLKTKLNQ